MIIKKGIYRHYKGGLYEVLENGILENNLEECVIYKSLSDSGDFGKGQIWIRPVKSFLEELEIDGKKVRRFQLVKNQ